MSDIVPELLEKIQRDFNRSFKRNKTIQSIQKKIDDKVATHIDIHNYSVEVGNILAESFNKNLHADVLPDEKMYYNIAEGILNPTLGNNHDLISTALQTVQTNLNQKAGFGLKGVKAPVNQELIDGIINRISVEDNFDDVKWILDEPVVTFSQRVVDEGIEKNAEFQAESGMEPKINRIVKGHDPCDWCKSLEGSYSYPNETPEDVFKRHDNCRCIVEYDPGNSTKQDVWTKKWRTEKEKEKIEQRKTIGL